MYQPDRTHPAFDETLEMLSLLPCSPTFTTLASLKDDFGFFAQAKVREVLNKIVSRHKIKLVSGNENGRTISIAASHWSKAQKLAKEYIESVESVGQETVAV